MFDPEDITEADYLDSHAYDGDEAYELLCTAISVKLKAIESRIDAVRELSVGAKFNCPVCQGKAKKKAVHQKFCSTKCKDHYWNMKRSIL